MCDSFERPAPRTLVLGVGNLLLGDEGFGVHVVRLLQKEGVPDGVSLEDGGTAGVDLLDLMTAYDRVVLVDLLRAVPGDTLPRVSLEVTPPPEGGVESLSGDEARRHPAPGALAVFRLTGAEALEAAPSLSLHGCSLAGMMHLARALEMRLPEITVVGTFTGDLIRSTELSEAVQQAAHEAVKIVRRLIGEREVRELRG